MTTRKNAPKTDIGDVLVAATRRVTALEAAIRKAVALAEWGQTWEAVQHLREHVHCPPGPVLRDCRDCDDDANPPPDAA